MNRHPMNCGISLLIGSLSFTHIFLISHHANAYTIELPPYSSLNYLKVHYTVEEHHDSDDVPDFVQVEATEIAYGSRRLHSVVHLVDEQPHHADWIDVLTDSEMISITPGRRRCERSKLLRDTKNADKIRLLPYFESIGWWPIKDKSEPPTVDGWSSFSIFRNAEGNHLPNEIVGEHLCSVWEFESRERVYMNHDLLAKREIIVDGKIALSVTIEESREVAPGISLPFVERNFLKDGRRVVFSVSSVTTEATPIEYEHYLNKPGFVDIDLDTLEMTLVAGGIDLLDKTIHLVQNATDKNNNSREPTRNAFVVCSILVGALIVPIFSTSKRLST